MCNAIPIRWPLRSGIVRVEPDEGYASVFDRVTALAGGPRPLTAPWSRPVHFAEN